ncbi:MAG: hypothetical protein ACRDGT_12465 [Candidatus Limnocylindria bacterium]
METGHRQTRKAQALNGHLVDASAVVEDGGDRALDASGNGTPPLSLRFPSELIDVIAERAAELLTGRGSPDDGWLRGADRIAAYIDCPRSRVYALVSARRIPVHHDGSALIARRLELDRWIREGGGRRA